jgi:hypothetical protein
MKSKYKVNDILKYKRNEYDYVYFKVLKISKDRYTIKAFHTTNCVNYNITSIDNNPRISISLKTTLMNL